MTVKPLHAREPSVFCLQACLLHLHSVQCLLSSCLLVASAQCAVHRRLTACQSVSAAQHSSTPGSPPMLPGCLFTLTLQVTGSAAWAPTPRAHLVGPKANLKVHAPTSQQVHAAVHCDVCIPSSSFNRCADQSRAWFALADNARLMCTCVMDMQITDPVLNPGSRFGGGTALHCCRPHMQAQNAALQAGSAP